MTIVAHVPNLFDRSRFRGQVTFVETADEAKELKPSLLIVDLDRCEDVPGFNVEGATVIGFGPHVDTSLYQLAEESGYTEVLSRSVFFKRLPELLSSVE